MSDAEALDPDRRRELIERFRLDDIRNHRWSGNPGLDQLERSYSEPHHRSAPAYVELCDTTTNGPNRAKVVLTPYSRRPARVEGYLLRHDPRTMVDAVDYADLFDIDYIHSNLPNRKPLPLKSPDDPNYGPDQGIYSSAELRDEYVGRGVRPLARREALARAESNYVAEVVPASLTQGLSVIPHFGVDFADWRVGESLPDGECFVHTKIAFPVPLGYTALRVGRMISKHAGVCVWCDAAAPVFDDSGLSCWSVMLVSTQTALHLIATCDRCIDEFGAGPDYYRYDRSDGRRGFPAEDFR